MSFMLEKVAPDIQIVYSQKVLEKLFSFTCAIFHNSLRSSATEITSCPLMFHVIAKAGEKCFSFRNLFFVQSSLM